MTHEPREELRVACAQLGGFATPEEALERIAGAAARARQLGAELVCLPHLSSTPYFPLAPRSRAFYNLGERGASRSLEVFTALAKEHGIWLAGSYYEIRDEGIFYVRAVLLDPDGTLVHSYRQVHVDRRPGSWELFYVQPARGEALGAAVQTPFGRVGLLLGADAQYPEAWRAQALAGAELVVLGLGEQARDLAHTVPQLAGAACANGLTIVAANRRGVEYGHELPGGSRVLGVDGEAAPAEEHGDGELLLVALDLAPARRAHALRGVMRGRRPDQYASLLTL